MFKKVAGYIEETPFTNRLTIVVFKGWTTSVSDTSGGQTMTQKKRFGMLRLM